MDFDSAELVEVFKEEALEHLDEMERHLVAVEAEPDSRELLDAIFRNAHTVKGNAASLGFKGIADLADHAESALERVRAGEAKMTREMVSALLEARDELVALVRHACEVGDASLEARSDVTRRLARFSGRDAVSVQEGDVAQSAQVGEGLHAWEHERSTTFRVDIERLDQMLSLAGEIAVAQSRLGAVLGATLTERREDAVEALMAVERLCTDLHEEIMRVRMVPIGSLFRQLNRAVREASVTSGKRVTLVTEGDDVEIDTAVAGLLRDPLTHMVRNAVDHGIESAAKRRDLGKPELGRVAVRATHDSGSILVEVEDDGAGLQLDEIADQARTGGLLAEADTLDLGHAASLIMTPGLSTAKAITQISGRGVGMDVVARNVEALRGTLDVASEAGIGTRFAVRLPLTLAIIDAFLFAIESDVYMVPLDSVVECSEFKHGDFTRQGESGVMNLRGKPLPVVHLDQVFGHHQSQSARRSVVVVEKGKEYAGLVVGDLLGQDQVVIKPLPKALEASPYFSGSAILGSGRVGMILDVSRLLSNSLARGDNGR